MVFRRFQKFAGLKPTGKLDEITEKKMQQKRCGRPDVIALRQKGLLFPTLESFHYQFYHSFFISFIERNFQ